MAADADRHLLFGLIALQVGLVDQDRLVAAFRAWSRDRSRPLADHLADAGGPCGEGRAAVEALAALHLDRHGGDAEASLASVPGGRSARDRLAALGDPELTVTVDRPGPGQGLESTDVDLLEDRTTTYAAQSSLADGRRFRVLRPHARGGLGAVFVALDEELHREVALKQILDGHADDPASRQRFLREAEITGGLEHPGIVPVYGLGVDRDGRPYYAMRFIQGDSLKEAIAAHRQGREAAGDSGARTLGLQKLLRRFLDVCNAIDYAHGRGVLHRDLKPANIIIGRYGETLVVDWGLAKALGGPEAPAPGEDTPLRPASAGGSEATLPGSALGTPAYMSPEQASGRLEALGPRSDVYSLGATLYCLLTGRPPFGAGDVGAILRAVRRGDLEPPRGVAPDVDRALEAVCLKAMALDPGDRYPSARALAEDVERWIADEPVTAWREPLVRRARRWVRRNRGPVGAAAAAAVVGVAALGVVALQSDRAARRLAAKNRELSAANVEVERARGRAEASLGQARDAVDTYFTKVSESRLLNVPGLQPLRKELLDTALGYYRGFLRDRGDDPTLARQAARVQYRVGQIAAQIGTDAQALADLGRARSALAALAAKAPADAELTRDRASVENAIGVIREGLAEFGLATEAYARAAALREPLAAGPSAPAVDRAQLAVNLSNLGHARARSGRPEEGLADVRRAIGLLDGAIRDEPGDPDHRRDLARCLGVLASLLTNRGQPRRALDASVRSRELYDALHREYPEIAEYPFELAIALSLEGYQLRTNGRPDDALVASERSIALLRELVAASPRVMSYRNRLAISYNMAGDLARQLGRTDALGEFASRAIEILDGLRRDDPESTGYHEDLSKALNNLGRFEAARGRRAEALAAFRRSIALKESLPGRDPVGEYNLACNLALAMTVAGDPQGPGGDASAEREALADRALDALRRAVAGGMKAREIYQSDPDLDPLRDRPEFRALIRDLPPPPERAASPT